MTNNSIQIETQTGLKEFELVHGDITNLPFKVDLLCISAFMNDYKATPTSIIGQLYNKGVDVKKLSQQPKLDFKESLGIWVSEKLDNSIAGNIICVEIMQSDNDFETTLKNLFTAISALEIQGENNRSIAIPLIGSGDQQFDPKIVIPVLLETSLAFLQNSSSVEKVYFVVYSEKKAAKFNEAMNSALGRNAVNTSNR